MNEPSPKYPHGFLSALDKSPDSPANRHGPDVDYSTWQCPPMEPQRLPPVVAPADTGWIEQTDGTRHRTFGRFEMIAKANAADGGCWWFVPGYVNKDGKGTIEDAMRRCERDSRAAGIAIPDPAGTDAERIVRWLREPRRYPRKDACAALATFIERGDWREGR